MRLFRPEISLAAVAAIFLGTMMAADVGPIAWDWLGVVAVAAVCFEAANNATRRLFRDARLGDPLGEVSAARPRAGITAAVLYAAALGIGFVIVTFREGGAVWLGGAGAVLTYFYHAPPMQLSWRGLGPVAAGIGYGPLVVGGTFLVLHGDISATAGYAALPLGLLIAEYVLVSEFSSHHAELAAGRQTLAARIGHAKTSRVFAAVMLAAFVVTAILPLLPSGVDRGVWAGLVGLPPGLLAARELPASPDDATEITHAQSWTMLAFVLYAVGAGFGILFT